MGCAGGLSFQIWNNQNTLTKMMTKSGLSMKFVFTYFSFRFMRPITVVSQEFEDILTYPRLWIDPDSVKSMPGCFVSCLHFMPLWFDEYFKDFVSFHTIHVSTVFCHSTIWRVFFSRCSYKKLNRWTRTGIRIVICLFLLEYVDALRLRLVFRIRPFAMYNVWKSQKCLMWIFNLPKIKNNSVCQVLKKFGVKIQIFCLKSLVSGWTF